MHELAIAEYADQLARVDVLGKERRIDEVRATEALSGLQMMGSGSDPPNA